jgi:TPR repeat protein
LYEEGEGVSRDHDRAEIYYRAAAELGDAAAQYEVGRVLFWGYTNVGRDVLPKWEYVRRKSQQASGLVDPLDAVEAADWYSKASDQNHAQAQSQLAILYAEGIGVPADQVRAANLFRKAAEQGYPNAQYELAEMYSSGTGVPKDRDEATRWYRKAARQGHKLAQDCLDGFDFAGDPLSQNGAIMVEWLESADE